MVILFTVKVNLKYPLDFIGMEGIDLNQFFYEDIEEVSDEERNMEYTIFENDYEMQEDVGVSNNELNPFQFLSSTWYMFSRKAYTYMIQCIKGETVPIGKMVVDVDPQFFNLDWATVDMEHEALKKWKIYEDGLAVRSLPNDEDRLHNKLPKKIHLVLPLVEEWKVIVTLSHTSRNPHLGITTTKDHILGQGWLVGAQNHGIPEEYTREFIHECSCISTKSSNEVLTPTRNKRKKYIFEEVIKVPPEAFDDKMKELIFKYQVCFYSLYCQCNYFL
jgi:hypothetical protein